MNVCLNRQQKDEFVKRGFSRRDLGRVAAMMAAGAALPFWNEPAMAQVSAIRGPMPADAVMINANENPLGPCEEALAAGAFRLSSSTQTVGRDSRCGPSRHCFRSIPAKSWSTS